MCLNDFSPHTVFWTDKPAKLTGAVLVSFECSYQLGDERTLGVANSL